MSKYFGTDGIRGVVGGELDLGVAVNFGYALGAMLGEGASVVIGKDTRLSGSMLEAAVSAALSDCNVNVSLMGVAPTPAIAEAVRSFGFDAGVVISASHNPPEFNGLKVFGRDGYKLEGSGEEEIERLMTKISSLKRRTASQKFGKISTEFNLISAYFDTLKKLDIGDIKKLKIVIDCGYGAAATTALSAFGIFASSPLFVASDPLGGRINVGAGATSPQMLSELVVKTGADLGFGFDGDADRIVAINCDGSVIDGDKLLYINALDLHRNGRLKSGAVVGTVMSNLGLEQGLKRKGLELLRTSVGDKYVIEKMRERGCEIGGEASGHIIFGNLSTTGDGVLTALMTASIVARSGKSLGELLADYQHCPQVLVNIDSTEKTGRWLASHEFEELTQGLTKEYASDLRLIVRPSGTERLIRIMAMSPSAEAAQKAAALITEFLKQ